MRTLTFILIISNSLYQQPKYLSTHIYFYTYAMENCLSIYYCLSNNTLIDRLLILLYEVR